MRKPDDLPAGAWKLGCRNCRPREPKKYCASCPVTLRQQDGKPWVIQRGGSRAEA